MGPDQPTARVVRGTVAFAAAAVIQRLVGFLLLPVYARVLEPAEYGQVAVLMTLTSAMGTLLGLGLETAVFRRSVQLGARPIERSQFVNTVGVFGVSFPIAVGVGLAVALSPFFAQLFAVPTWGVALSIIGGAAWIATTNVPLALLRAQERLRAYMQLSILQAGLTVGLTVAFVVVLRLGSVGWMLAFGIAAGLALVVGLAMLGHRWTSRLERRELVAALAFGLPMLPHALAHWGLSLSDRAVLGAFVDQAQVGAYYVAFQFCLPISVIVIAVNQASQPLYAEASLDASVDAALARTATHHVVVTAMLMVAVALLGPPAVLELLPDGYAPAAQYIPVLAIGQALFGLYFLPMNAITMLSGRNRWVWIVTVSAALANVGLNLMTVPAYGATAAAVNTVVGYAILLGGVWVYMLRVVERPIRYEWSRIGIGLLVILGVAAPAFIFGTDDPMIDLLVRGGALFIVSWLLTATGLVRVPVLRSIRSGRAR